MSGDGAWITLPQVLEARLQDWEQFRDSHTALGCQCSLEIFLDPERRPEAFRSRTGVDSVRVLVDALGHHLRSCGRYLKEEERQRVTALIAVGRTAESSLQWSGGLIGTGVVGMVARLGSSFAHLEFQWLLCAAVRPRDVSAGQFWDQLGAGNPT